jgi:hypothetical protein
MQKISFAASAGLAIAGVWLGVSGISHEYFKQTATGFVLLLGAGVFALLTIGLRRPTRHDREAT